MRVLSGPDAAASDAAVAALSTLVGEDLTGAAAQVRAARGNAAAAGARYQVYQDLITEKYQAVLRQVGD